MKTNFVPIESAIREWKEDSGFEGEVKETSLLRWANETVSKVMTDEQLQFSIGLFDIEDYKVRLPDNFKMVVQAAVKIPSAPLLRKEKLVEWVQKTVDGSNCEVTTRIDCKTCNENDPHPEVVVDVDRNWLAANPQASASFMRTFAGFTTSLGDSSFKFAIQDSFMLMRHTTNNFHNIPFHVEGCLNLNVDSEVDYSIDLPHMIVSAKEGQVLLSYLGRRVDDRGYLMIPDDPYMFEAIFFSIEARIALQQWRKSKQPQDRFYYDKMFAMSNSKIAQAKSRLQIPEADEWLQTLRIFWSRDYPYYERESNFNRYKPDRSNYSTLGYDNGKRP